MKVEGWKSNKTSQVLETCEVSPGIAKLLLVILFAISQAACVPDTVEWWKETETSTASATQKVENTPTSTAALTLTPTFSSTPTPTNSPSATLSITPTPTHPPTASPTATIQPIGLITYNGTAEITQKRQTNCTSEGKGSLYLASDNTFRAVIIGPVLNDNCSLAGNTTLEWDITGAYHAGVLTFQGCNDINRQNATGSGVYSDNQASGTASCLNNNGEVISTLVMKFTR